MSAAVMVTESTKRDKLVRLRVIELQYLVLRALSTLTRLTCRRLQLEHRDLHQRH
jgi:hypothetical protein